MSFVLLISANPVWDEDEWQLIGVPNLFFVQGKHLDFIGGSAGRMKVVNGRVEAQWSVGKNCRKLNKPSVKVCPGGQRVYEKGRVRQGTGGVSLCLPDLYTL